MTGSKAPLSALVRVLGRADLGPRSLMDVGCLAGRWELDAGDRHLPALASALADLDKLAAAATCAALSDADDAELHAIRVLDGHSLADPVTGETTEQNRIDLRDQLRLELAGVLLSRISREGDRPVGPDLACLALVALAATGTGSLRNALLSRLRQVADYEAALDPEVFALTQRVPGGFGGRATDVIVRFHEELFVRLRDVLARVVKTLAMPSVLTPPPEPPPAPEPVASRPARQPRKRRKARKQKPADPPTVEGTPPPPPPSREPSATPSGGETHEDRYLSVNEAAALCGVHRSSLYVWLADPASGLGQIAVRLHGGRLRFPERRLRAWIEKRRR